MTENEFWGIPQFIWSGIFTLLAGMLVAYFTSTFLKKKEERTRVAGIIVEKRLSSEQEIQKYLEQKLTKEEWNEKNSHHYDKTVTELLKSFHIEPPYGDTPQYAFVFLNYEAFHEFFLGFEKVISDNRLWLDKKVRKQLTFMQMYFSAINVIPLLVKRIPLPNKRTLTNEQFQSVCDRATLLYGIALDAEINYLMAQLDKCIVDSVYRLDFDRPKNSILKPAILNRQMKRIFSKTMLGLQQEDFFSLVISLVYTTTGVTIENFSKEELSKILSQALHDANTPGAPG